MARYSLFVLKVPLNPKQASKQTNHGYVEAEWVTCSGSIMCRSSVSRVPWFSYRCFQVP